MKTVPIEKITAFITRPSGNLLLFEHPYAGIQIPAGTVENGEAIEQAVLREVREETGLTDNLTVTQYLGSAYENPPTGQAITIQRLYTLARTLSVSTGRICRAAFKSKSFAMPRDSLRFASKNLIASLSLNTPRCLL